MALPPKADPRRPLHLAVRSMWVLGVVFLLLGTCGSSTFLFSVGSAGGASRGMTWTYLLLVGSMVLVYCVPGMLYILFAIYVRRHRFWAVVAALILASIHTLFILFGTIAIVVQIALGTAAEIPGVARVIMAVVVLLFFAAFAQLLYHLSVSFRALHLPPFETETRGFEPLPVAPVFRPNDAPPFQ